MIRRRLVICLAVCLLGPTLLLTDVEPLNPDTREAAYGNHALRFILKTLSLRPLQSMDELAEAPRETILIFLGNPAAEPNSLLDTRIDNFIEVGGAVLLASDRSVTFMDVEIVGDLVSAQDEKHGYKGRYAECPLVPEFNHDIFKGIKQIATNKPSYLALPERQFRSVAWFAKGSQVNDKPRPHLAFAAVHEGDGVRHVVLSDHSVFINSMMLQEDNDNFAFAINCVRWLSDGGKRDRVLFIDDGRIVTSFDVTVREIPAALPDHPVDLINNLLTKWERENIHNELLLEQFRSPSQLLSILAIAATVILAVYLFFRMQMAHHRMETSP